MPAKDISLLFVRLTEAEKRRIKTLAVSQGLTLREAILQAFEAWAEKLQSHALPADPARVTPAGADWEKPGSPKRAATPRQDRQRAEGALPSTSGGGQGPKQAGPSRAWLSRAGQLDWSKCPAAERVRGKMGHVWVVRGTDAPLAEIFQSVADGHPFLEIAEVFEITLRQLVAILQFAAEGAIW